MLSRNRLWYSGLGDSNDKTTEIRFYFFNIPNNETFSVFLEDAQKSYARENKALQYDYIEEENFGREISKIPKRK